MATQKQTAVQASGPTKMQRFTHKVWEIADSHMGDVNLTDKQRALIGSYYIHCDRALQAAEENRQRKNRSEKDASKKNDLPVAWANINMEDLALDLVQYSKLGLDMAQDNHLFAIPYKNNKANNYDLNLMVGYMGKVHIANTFAVDKPQEVVVELVYSTDKFKPLKKKQGQEIESYEFEITNAFDRGEVVGGFGYIRFADPKKNRLIIMSKADMDKRKPQYASPEFWGGEKYNYATKKKEPISGWSDEMYLKTLMRHVYSSKYIPLDSAILADEAYRRMQRNEERAIQAVAAEEIAEEANTIDIDSMVVDDDGVVMDSKPLPKEKPSPKPASRVAEKDEKPLPDDDDAPLPFEEAESADYDDLFPEPPDALKDLGF